MVFRMDRAAQTLLDDLHRSHDGPPPRDALQTTILGGSTRRTALAHAAALALHSRLASEARLGAARRRATLPASSAPADPWLTRLSATLAHHRHTACGAQLFYETDEGSGFSTAAASTVTAGAGD